MAAVELSRREQLARRFQDSISFHIEKMAKSLEFESNVFPPDLISKAAGILVDHDITAEKMNSEYYKKLLRKERMLRGDADSGIVICIDGREMPVFMSEPDVAIWEEPGSFFKVKNLEPNKKKPPKYFVDSEDLGSALMKSANKNHNHDLFDIVFAHTSLRTDHICGFAKALSEAPYMEGGENRLRNLKGKALVEKNLEILEKEQIPAMTNTYNSARAEGNKLKRVAVSALFDTDTYGIVLNYGKNEFSTTNWLENGDVKKLINDHLGYSFGYYKDDFTNPNYFIPFYKDLVDLTEILITQFRPFKDQVSKYINDNYKDLTNEQKQAFLFRLAKTTAFQYITGLSHIEKGATPDHPFADHHERYATVTTEGAIIDAFNVVKQSFKVTASSADAARVELDTVVLGLLDKYDDDSEKRHIAFLTSIADDTSRDSEAIERNRILLESILQNDRIRSLVEKGRLLLIPVLIDKRDKKIKEIPKHFI